MISICPTVPLDHRLNVLDQDDLYLFDLVLGCFEFGLWGVVSELNDLPLEFWTELGAAVLCLKG